MSNQEFDRLKIKQDLLDRQDPPLSYVHLEIINAPAIVDSTLVEALDTGQMELTDALFFECLEESPDYLAFEPFRKRIKEWQEALQEPSPKKEKERRDAKKNLEQIGKTLGEEPYQFVSFSDPSSFNIRKVFPKGPGCPPKWDQFAIYRFVEDNTPVIQQFLDDNKEVNRLKTKKNNFRERFPDWADHADALGSNKRHHRSAREIIKNIAIRKYGISRKELLNILKTVKFLLNLPNLDK
jgi:hypothetical protein